GMVTSSRQTMREVAAMRRIRIQKPKPIRRELEVLPLDARDPDVVRAKALIRARSCARGASLACPVATPLHRERVEEPSFAGSLRSGGPVPPATRLPRLSLGPATWPRAR